MFILGIDPGYAIIGYGCISFSKGSYIPVGYGAITTHADTPFNQRLEDIYIKMCEILKLYKPEAIAIEKLYFNNNQKTAICVAEARGVILLAAQLAKVPVFEYTPLQVKSAVAGYGQATKQQVMKMTQRLLRLSEIPKPDDTADALAIAICHTQAHGSELTKLLIQRGCKTGDIQFKRNTSK